MLVLIPMAVILFASLFVIWRHDTCGPKYPDKCGPEKDNMVTLFAWSFATCVLLIAVPFCSACFFSYFKNMRLIPNEAVGLICYISAIATTIGALYYYFSSSIVFSDGVLSATAWGQWLFVIPTFGVFIVAIFWVVTTALSYRARLAMEQASALRLESIIVDADRATDDEADTSSVVDERGPHAEPPPKLSLMKHTQNWASRSFSNVVHGARRVLGPSREDFQSERYTKPTAGSAAPKNDPLIKDESSDIANTAEKGDESSSSTDALLLAEPAPTIAPPPALMDEGSTSSSRGTDSFSESSKSSNESSPESTTNKTTDES